MIRIDGKYNGADCFTDVLEPSAMAQIKAVCDEKAFEGAKIRIMPDVHAGKGCTIGTTMTITDKVVPGMVGVDIGCGMETVKLNEKEMDLEALDKLIQREIPCGRDIRKTVHPLKDEINLGQLRCANYVNLERASLSIGTLGGGNHFIEVDRDENGNLYLVVHSGSRHLGCEVAEYYQNEGYASFIGNAHFQVANTIIKLKEEGRYDEIQPTISRMRKLRESKAPISKDLAYVEGQLFDDYIHDMKIIQRFAALNRKAITDTIVSGMGVSEAERFTTIHNYIDTDEMIMRKGAVSAKKGEKLLIPINMRDGSLICIGKGNEDWNCSAPHGAGRLMSRMAAVNQISMEEYRKSMEGIYSSCVNRSTLDESPMAYKSMEHIVSHIEPTAEIISIIRPIYNFKAGE